MLGISRSRLGRRLYTWALVAVSLIAAVNLVTSFLAYRTQPTTDSQSALWSWLGVVLVCAVPLLFSQILAQVDQWSAALRKYVLLLIVEAIVVIAFFLIPRGYQSPLTGFGEYTGSVEAEDRAKTLWDWMGLLIIPVALGVGAFWLERMDRTAERERAAEQEKIERDLAEERAKVERELAAEQEKSERDLAEKRARAERRLAKDNLREAALQAYLDRMSELLVHDRLREADSKEARHVAKARTLTVLRRLDDERKVSLLRFLYESDLITADRTVIDLAEADLNGIKLSGMILSGIDLSGASLRKAELRSATLRGADLKEGILEEAQLGLADLSEAVLREARLSNADLESATLTGAQLIDAEVESGRLKDAVLNNACLIGASLCGADLTKAYMDKSDLTDADLTDAILVQAELTGVDFSGATLARANLTGAVLTGAMLSGANLREAVLIDAKLDQADLTDADLRGARIRSEQLEDVKSLERALL